MSSPANFTDEQILAQLLAAEQTQQVQPGQQPPPLPKPAAAKITIGNQEFDVTDAAGIQAAIQEQQNEFARVQTLLREQQAQVEPPPVPQFTQPQVQPQAPQPRTRKKAWTPDNLAEELKQRDLPSVFDEMLGSQLGVDSLLQAFQGLAQRSMAQEQAYLKIAEKIDGLDGRITQESRERASINFLREHEDEYIPTPENMQMIDTYLRKDGLQWNENGLRLAFLHAKADNMLKLNQVQQQTQQTQQPQQTQQFNQPQGVTAQPSLRGGSAAMNTEAAIIDRFEKLSTQEKLNFIESFGQ